MTAREIAPTRTLNDEDRAFFRNALRENAIPVLSTVGNVLFNRANFVARQDDEGPFGNTVKALTRYNCRRWAQADKTGFSARINTYNASVCNPYLATLGEAPGEGEAGRQFDGGQCDGINYDVTATDNRANTGGTGVYRVTGPFGGTRTRVSGRDINGRPNGYIGEIFARRWWFPGGNPPASGEPRWIQVFSNTVSPTSQGVTFITNNVVRLPIGQPDNCGNPAPVVRPPDRVFPTNPVPPSIVVNIPGFGPAEVNITFDNVGNPTFNFPELGFSFDVQDGGGGGGGAGDQTSPGSPGSPSDTGPGGDTEGDVPPGEELVGLLVEVISAPPNAPRFANNPLEPYRGIGYVRMGYPGRLGLDVSAGVAAPVQFYHAPQRGLTKWTVNANILYNLRVTPYTREIEP